MKKLPFVVATAVMGRVMSDRHEKKATAPVKNRNRVRRR